MAPLANKVDKSQVDGFDICRAAQRDYFFGSQNGTFRRFGKIKMKKSFELFTRPESANPKKMDVTFMQSTCHDFRVVPWDQLVAIRRSFGNFQIQRGKTHA